ncbi:MAG: hypothetical protein NZO16_01650 [Deltaproteobacteria bacterium]|nr:hypothetical protein [Deltaproteobacteria bacterium]
MIKEFRSLAKSLKSPIYFYSDSPKFLAILGKIFVSELIKQKREFVKFNCICESQNEFKNFLALASQRTLSGNRRFLLVYDIQSLSKKNLELIQNLIEHKSDSQLILSSLGEIKHIAESCYKKGVVFNGMLKTKSTVVKIAKEILPSQHFKLLADQLADMSVEDSLNALQIARLLDDTQKLKSIKKAELGVKEIVEEFFDSRRALTTLKKLSSQKISFMVFNSWIQRRLFALLYMKQENQDKNFKVVPFWIRSQLANNLKSWSEEQLRRGLISAVLAEIKYKTNPLNDRELTFLMLNEIA